ncbi:MAG: hypothetical protein SFW07_01370 [Gammaproteobacteria bacterium]|nr:hypothetical protein [Gammaproteobacteria bacterium]
MSQDLQEQPLTLLNADENDSWSNFFKRELKITWQLTKNTAPVALTRFITYLSDVGVYTWVASRAGPSFLAEIVIPLSYMDASYWIISALFALGINIVKVRIANNDSGVANYFYAGTGLGVALPVVLTLPGFFAVSYGLQLTPAAHRFGAILTGDVICRNIEMHSRQVMIGTGHRICRVLDGAHVSLLTGIIKAGVFFGLSSYFVPDHKFTAFLASRFTASALKILFDSLFLMHSGRVFLRPHWREILADKKNIMINGWKISAQIFCELTVVGSLSIYIAVSKDQLKLIAFRVASTLDGALSPWTSGWVRGVQRMHDHTRPLENIRLSNRAFLITILSALIPVVLYVGVPRPFLSIFIQDPMILNVGENIARLFSSGQFFYVLYAFMQSMLWVLFKDSGFSMGTSIGAALFFFAVTLPLVLTATGSFDDVMGVYVAYTTVGFLSLLGRYINRVNSDESSDAENVGRFGLLPSSRSVPQVAHTKHITEEDLVEFLGNDSQIIKLV